MSGPSRAPRTVRAVEEVGPACFRIAVEFPEPPSAVEPGQFFMLRRADGQGPLLPRPFSLERLGDGLASFLAKVIGPGTRALAALRPGEGLVLTGPLGRGFPPVRPDDGAVLLAGGIGIAPFPHVVERARAAGVSPRALTLVFGAASGDQHYALPLFESYGIRIVLATDDGSRGFRGNALAAYEAEVEARRIDARAPVFACGPERMLEAVARRAREKDRRAHVSLETFMACGVGICNGCAVPVEPGAFDGWPYAKACREGPVFDARLLRGEKGSGTVSADGNGA